MVRFPVMTTPSTRRNRSALSRFAASVYRPRVYQFVLSSVLFSAHLAPSFVHPSYLPSFIPFALIPSFLLSVRHFVLSSVVPSFYPSMHLHPALAFFPSIHSYPFVGHESDNVGGRRSLHKRPLMYVFLLSTVPSPASQRFLRMKQPGLCSATVF